MTAVTSRCEVQNGKCENGTLFLHLTVYELMVSGWYVIQPFYYYGQNMLEILYIAKKHV